MVVTVLECSHIQSFYAHLSGAVRAVRMGRIQNREHVGSIITLSCEDDPDRSSSIKIDGAEDCHASSHPSHDISAGIIRFQRTYIFCDTAVTIL